MLRNYLKIALRNLRTQRHYALLNIIGLAVGIAGGLLIFLFIRHHLSTDRHQANFDRIVRISTDLHLDDGSVEYNAEGPPPMAEILRAHYPQVEQAAFLLGIRELNVRLKRPAKTQPTRFLEHDGVGFVEAEWLDVLSYTWLQGNQRTALHSPGQAVLSASWAKRYFGTTTVLGQTLLLDNKALVTIVGVVADPTGPTDTNLGLFISLATARQVGVSPGALTDWYALNSTNRVYARLKRPTDIGTLQQAMPALEKQQYGQAAHFFHFLVQPLASLHFDTSRDPAHAIPPNLLWSLGIVGLLLVIAACINFINLATAQALRRGKEVGIRKTLGSSRGQLVGQFLLDTLLVTLAATVLAVTLAYLLLPLFNNWIQLSLTLRPDALTISFMLGLLLTVVTLAGLYPALAMSGGSARAALRGRLMVSVSGLRIRWVLVIIQFTVCQGLLLGTLVVVSQVRYIQQVDWGFKKDNVVLVGLPYDQKVRHDAFKQALGRQSGILSVSLSNVVPANPQMYGGQLKVDGKADWEPFPVRERLADADFLQTYGLKLLAGHNISPGDTIRDYVINETLMHKLGFQHPEQVLGHRLQYHLAHVPRPIVGVVSDFHLRSFRHEIEPCIIANWAPWYRQAGIRIAGNDPAKTLQHIRQTWQQIFPDEVFDYQFLNWQLATFYETETLIARLINVFTGIAMLICCLGLYGLVSHVVVQRTKEIGIRKVLGASVASLVVLLSSDFLKLVLIAIVVASPIAWYAMNRWLQGFAYRIDIEWWMFTGAGLLAVAIALLTVSVQSVRAALMNPVKSLRSE